MGSPGLGAEPSRGTIRWGESEEWSGSLTGAGGFIGDDVGNLAICPEGACDDYLLDVQVAPSPDDELVRFVQIELAFDPELTPEERAAADFSVDLVVFPPASNPTKEGIRYLRTATRLIEPASGEWRIQARCFDICPDIAYSMKATTGSLDVPRAVAHRPGGTPRPGIGQRPHGRMMQVFANATEPTLAFTDDGSLFYQANVMADQPVPEVMRSRDDGITWRDVSPELGPLHRHPISQSAYLHVDEGTSRLFTADQVPPCNEVSFSDDYAESWTTSAYCHNLPDHQSVFTGPPVSSRTAGYPNIVYTCVRVTNEQSPSTTSCSKSLDGGLTFLPTGAPPYVNAGGLDQCGTGLPGPGVAGPDGSIYVPRGYCEPGKDRLADPTGLEPYVAISRDEGRTWTLVRVADNGFVSDFALGIESAYQASMAVDDDGTLYYTWAAADRLPYLVFSKDAGVTWSEPMMIAAPGVNEAALPSVDAGAPGRIAIAYMGTKDSPWPGSADYEGVGWNGYITMTTKALKDDPTLLTATVNDPADPLVVGSCGPFRCRNTANFFDVAIGPDGTPWAAFVDECVVDEPRCDSFPGITPSEGIVGRLVGGPSLR